MKEKKAKSVTFEDIGTSALKEILKYIYTGAVEIADQKSCKDLLYGAEKFGLEDLKSVCVAKFIEDLTVINALELLAIADLFYLFELEEKCLDIIMT